MLTFLARMKVKPEKEQEFIRLARELTREVHEKEPQTTGYEFFKLRDQALGYAVYEQFVSEAAEEAHLNTPHFKRIAPGLIECLDGTYVREYLDPLA
ncbi:MAG TPA: putative quinol monooxygenase [Xanthomonadales bacterium]|nr:putative quinol monooxygenase [Xanthomonadales bacterium]